MGVITISRMHGCGGATVGQRVAELLGYDFVDRELIKHVAEIVEVPEEEVMKFDEAHVNPIIRFIHSLLRHGGKCADVSWTPSLVRNLPIAFADEERALESGFGELDHELFTEMVQRVIEQLYERGNVVILGRGAMVVLKDKPMTFHVRLVAPLPWRIEYLSRQQDISHDEARDEIAHNDKRRALYVRQFYHVDWDDPSLYHLIINIARVGVEGAVQMIVNGARHCFSE